MANAILSRGNSPIRGGKIGDIKYTQRTLTPDWKKCDGSIIDPTEVSNEYTAMCDGEAFINGQYIALNNSYSMMSDAMKAEYDKSYGTNDNLIFFWDNGNQRGSGFISTTYIEYNSHTSTLFLELADGSIKQIQINKCSYPSDGEGTWHIDPQYDIEIKAYNSCTDKVALIYKSRYYYYNDYYGETDSLVYGFICIDINTGEIIKKYAQYAASSSVGIDETSCAAAISNNCLVGAVYYEAFACNIGIPNDSGIICFNNIGVHYIDLHSIHNALGVDYEYMAMPSLACKMVPAENNVSVITYIKYYTTEIDIEAISFAINLITQTSNNIYESTEFTCNATGDAITEKVFAFIESKTIPRIIFNYSLWDSVDCYDSLHTTEFSIIDNAIIKKETSRPTFNPFNGNYSTIYSNKYGIQTIHNGTKMIDISNLIYNESGDYPYIFPDQVDFPISINSDHYFNNDKFLVIDKKLFGPLLPDDDSGYAYVKTE